MTEQEYNYAVFADNGQGIISFMLKNGKTEEYIKGYFDDASYRFSYHVFKRMLMRIRLSKLGLPTGPYDIATLNTKTVEELISIIKENNI